MSVFFFVELINIKILITLILKLSEIRQLGMMVDSKYRRHLSLKHQS